MVLGGLNNKIYTPITGFGVQDMRLAQDPSGLINQADKSIFLQQDQNVEDNEDKVLNIKA